MADGPAGFTQGFTCPALLRIPLGNGMAARKGLSPAAARLSRRFRSPSLSQHVVLQPRSCRNRSGLGSSPVARRYWGNHCYFLFLPLLRCFSSRRWPPRLQRAGFSHSDIRGSRVACTSPRLFAACHVLRRLWEPRHPPYALSYFVHAWMPSRKGGSTTRRVSLGSHFAYLAFRFFTTFSCRNMSLNASPD